MYANNLEQLIHFIYFIMTGMVLSMVFDIFRILRRSFKTSDLITNIEDVIFGVITGFLLLLSIFFFNNGELRFYIFIGIAIGILIYMLFFSKYFIKLNVAIINYIKKIFILLAKPIISFFKFLKKLFFKPISFIIINFNLFLQKMIKMVKQSTKIYKKPDKREGF